MKNRKLLILLLILSLLIFIFIFAKTFVHQSGKIIESKKIEKSGKPIKIDSQGLEQKLSLDESGKIEGEKHIEGKFLSGIEVLSGFGVAHLREKGSYHVIPVYVDLDFDLKPALHKFGLNSLGLLQLVVEPFLFGVSDPHGNIEVGNNFLLKIGFFPETSKIQPYFKGGVGLLYMSQHTLEQSTQFNFNEYVGFGVHFFFRKNLAFTIEYRYRHLSNASIKQPNSGINSNFGICGLSCIF